MTTTYNEAYDTITNRLISEWATNAANIVGTNPTPAPELRFARVEKAAVPTTHFARFTMQPVGEPQATFRNGEVQRYTATGLIHLQVFGWRDDDKAAEYLRLLSQIGQSIFRGKVFDGCIWFRNVRINHLEPEQKYYRDTVVGEYEFDTIG